MTLWVSKERSLAHFLRVYEVGRRQNPQRLRVYLMMTEDTGGSRFMYELPKHCRQYFFTSSIHFLSSSPTTQFDLHSAEGVRRASSKTPMVVTMAEAPRASLNKVVTQEQQLPLPMEILGHIVGYLAPARALDSPPLLKPD